MDSTKTLSAQDMIDQEILKGVAHGEKALEIKEMIGQLQEKRDLLNNMIDHEKTLLKTLNLDFLPNAFPCRDNVIPFGDFVCHLGLFHFGFGN